MIPDPRTCTSRRPGYPCSGRGCMWSRPRGTASCSPHTRSTPVHGPVVGVAYGWSRSLRGAAACFAVVAAFASVHPAVLSTDWMPYLYVPAYLAFIVAAASVAAGRVRDAWIMALAGWFLIHGHACFLFFVPVISCAVLAAVLWPRRHRLGVRLGTVLLGHAMAGVGACGGHQRRFRLPDHREPGAALAGPVQRLPGVHVLHEGGRAQHRAGGAGCAVVLVAVPGRMGLRNGPGGGIRGRRCGHQMARSRSAAPVPWALLAFNAVSSLAFLYTPRPGSILFPSATSAISTGRRRSSHCWSSRSAWSRRCRRGWAPSRPPSRRCSRSPPSQWHRTRRPARTAVIRRCPERPEHGPGAAQCRVGACRTLRWPDDRVAVRPEVMAGRHRLPGPGRADRGKGMCGEPGVDIHDDQPVHLHEPGHRRWPLTGSAPLSLVPHRCHAAA